MRKAEQEGSGRKRKALHRRRLVKTRKKRKVSRRSLPGRIERALGGISRKAPDAAARGERQAGPEPIASLRVYNELQTSA